MRVYFNYGRLVLLYPTVTNYSIERDRVLELYSEDGHLVATLNWDNVLSIAPMNELVAMDHPDWETILPDEES